MSWRMTKRGMYDRLSRGPNGREPSRRITVWLPQPMYDKLAAAATMKNTSLALQLVQRLEAGFSAEDESSSA